LRKEKYEAGLDFIFLRRLKLSATYYFNETRDMLLPALNPSSGFDTFLGNVAALQNKGFELEYDYSLFKKTEFICKR
jgi:outer membrane receptor protein involved in Fe transport